ncbi:hypothetical protein TRICHSKD4_1017 [Roseibium sp. TrichSKD4]|uniref:hypothetical protein n=1 Tax=Roseibium sp. TrichSKD4 TaxID=744980 RepID=UPI0001E56380|nr:hypothetical protein [Roseibium sp. TrichSKD4]EFO33898.1 hypothetical protein TRICHSKD4_1017 [Roseibium sp. TrichSKD4]
MRCPAERFAPKTALGRLAVRLASGQGSWRVSEFSGKRTGLIVGEALARAGHVDPAFMSVVTEFLVTFERAYLKSSFEHEGMNDGPQ